MSDLPGQGLDREVDTGEGETNGESACGLARTYPMDTGSTDDGHTQSVAHAAHAPELLGDARNANRARSYDLVRQARKWCWTQVERLTWTDTGGTRLEC